MRLAELGFNDSPVRRAYERSQPVIEEFEQTPRRHAADAGACRSSPAATVTGGVLLLRDVTEVRKRDRLLLSKDATIREIHHRVKNNLQTISSLLRLQGRRLTSPEAKAAVAESVRRIRTIALVHETLSREPGDDVAFLEIVRPLLRLAEEGLQSADRPVRFTVQGDGGRLPSTIATPLSVVLTELLQNAVDHGFPERQQWRRRRGAARNRPTISSHPGGQRRPRARPEVRAEQGHRARPVDRAHPGDDGAGRHASRCARARRRTSTAVGLGDQPKGAGTVVDLTVPIGRTCPSR